MNLAFLFFYAIEVFIRFKIRLDLSSTSTLSVCCRLPIHPFLAFTFM